MLSLRRGGAVGGGEVQLHRCSALIQHESGVLRQESVAHLSDGDGGGREKYKIRRSIVQRALKKSLNIAEEKKKDASGRDSFSLRGEINK